MELQFSVLNGALIKLKEALIFFTPARKAALFNKDGGELRYAYARGRLSCARVFRLRGMLNRSNTLKLSRTGWRSLAIARLRINSVAAAVPGPSRYANPASTN
jgi:hypothetical protein